MTANLSTFCSDWCGSVEGSRDWQRRVLIVLLALLIHAGFTAMWLSKPDAKPVAPREISFSIAFREPQPVVHPAPPKPVPPKPIPRPQPVVQPLPEPVAVEEVVEDVPLPEQVAAPLVAPVVQPRPVVLPDTEPDFMADYLDNPKPEYPRIARRMKYHGTVILDVEVLSEGRAGAISIHQSSGYESLDSAALQTVQTWRFVPARRQGQAITKSFLVPIKFSLEDEA